MRSLSVYVVAFMFLCILRTIVMDNIIPTISLLVFHRSTHYKQFSEECLKRASRIALTYCSSPTNSLFYSSSTLTFLAQCGSFSLRCLPYVGLGVSLACWISCKLSTAWLHAITVAALFACCRTALLFALDETTVDHLNALVFLASILAVFLCQIVNIRLAKCKDMLMRRHFLYEFLVLSFSEAHGVFAYCASVLGGHVATVMKSFFRQPRPTSLVPPHTLQCASSFGMPSEHSLICALWILYSAGQCFGDVSLPMPVRHSVPKWIWAIHALWFGVAVPLSRVVLGYHTVAQVRA